jgi:hypothetical protein
MSLALLAAWAETHLLTDKALKVKHQIVWLLLLHEEEVDQLTRMTRSTTKISISRELHVKSMRT